MRAADLVIYIKNFHILLRLPQTLSTLRAILARNVYGRSFPLSVSPIMTKKSDLFLDGPDFEIEEAPLFTGSRRKMIIADRQCGWYLATYAVPIVFMTSSDTLSTLRDSLWFISPSRPISKWLRLAHINFTAAHISMKQLWNNIIWSHHRFGILTMRRLMRWCFNQWNNYYQVDTKNGMR